MSMRFNTFWAVRRGNTPEQFEDAFAGAVATGRFAIADGASESCFADLWARFLVEEFVYHADCEPHDLDAFLSAAQGQWQEDITRRILPWYAEEGARQGAFSTFLGMIVEATGRSLLWRAAAIGDSCLFHIRKDKLHDSFPLDSWKQFDALPQLLGSRTPLKSVGAASVLKRNGSGDPGDRLLMMTDALAQWCLAQHEAGRCPWSQITSLLASPTGRMDFEVWVDEQRNTGQLQNDDVTLLAIDL